MRFNKPHITGNELQYISKVLETYQLAGNGIFTKKCHDYFESKYNFRKCLMTTSCTDALEMAALLCEIEPGDEVIMPSFTFVSTANAFVLRGARIVFVDSRSDHPGMDEDKIESLISPKTKAIIVVHYAGVACDMEKISKLANQYNLLVVEDAAQAIDSYFVNKKGQKRALGSLGHFATFSFHQTKNLTSGEGGLLVLNDERFFERAEIIWEKGTNRSAFFKGEVDKYGWVDMGSSFLPSEITSAFLWAQLEQLNNIQNRRVSIWKAYYDGLKDWAGCNNIRLPVIPSYATNNGHMFYLVCPSFHARKCLIEFLNDNGVKAVFHYQSLHSSEFFKEKHDDRVLENSDKYSDCLLRLPFYYDVDESSIIDLLLNFNEELQNK